MCQPLQLGQKYGVSDRSLGSSKIAASSPASREGYLILSADLHLRMRVMTRADPLERGDR